MCRFEFGDALLNARLRFRGVLLAFSCGCGRGLTCGGLVVGLGLDKPCFAARNGDEIQDAFLVGRFCVLAGVRKFGFEFGDTCVSRRQRFGIGVVSAAVAIIAPPSPSSSASRISVILPSSMTIVLPSGILCSPSGDALSPTAGSSPSGLSIVIVSPDSVFSS